MQTAPAVYSGHLPGGNCRVSYLYEFFPVNGAFFSGVLTVIMVSATRGGLTYDHAHYAVEELTRAEDLPFALWRAFAVAKCEAGVVDEGLYRVQIPGQLNRMAKPSCQCFGYNRHQHCRHIFSLATLIERGVI